jgi:hypothetical protein
MKHLPMVALVAVLFLLGIFVYLYLQKPDQPAVPNAPVVNMLPSFIQKKDEIEVSNGLGDTDPSFVIGSLVDLKSGQVFANQNFLIENPKFQTKLISENVFHSLIESGLASNVAWLDFLKAEVDATRKAELSVIKTGKVNIDKSQIDSQKLNDYIGGILPDAKISLGVIIAYSDFTISAVILNQVKSGAEFSGYGAKIAGNWYNRTENTANTRRIIAIYMPLAAAEAVVSSQGIAPELSLGELVEDPNISKGILDPSLFELPTGLQVPRSIIMSP